MIYLKLRAEMVLKRVDVSEIAKHLKLHKQSIYAKFTGRQTITLEEAIKIKKFIGSELPLDELFSRNENNEKEQ